MSTCKQGRIVQICFHPRKIATAIDMAMCHLLGAPGEDNPARVFHTMQAHLHARAPWALVGWAPGVAPGPLWARPLWAALGPCGLGPCGPPWALVGRGLVGPLGLCGPGQCGPTWALVGRALLAPPGHCGPTGPLCRFPPRSATAHGMTDDVIVTVSGFGSDNCRMTPDT